MADLSITAASVLAASSALVEHGQAKAGQATTAGQVLYKAASDGKLKLSDNDSATAEIKGVYGIALNGAADGQPISVIKRGQLTLNAVLTAGVVYCVSGTPGGIAPLADVTSGHDLIVLGVALSTTVLDVNFNDTGITL